MVECCGNSSSICSRSGRKNHKSIGRDISNDRNNSVAGLQVAMMVGGVMEVMIVVVVAVVRKKQTHGEGGREGDAGRVSGRLEKGGHPGLRNGCGNSKVVHVCEVEEAVLAAVVVVEKKGKWWWDCIW